MHRNKQQRFSLISQLADIIPANDVACFTRNYRKTTLSLFGYIHALIIIVPCELKERRAAGCNETFS